MLIAEPVPLRRTAALARVRAQRVEARLRRFPAAVQIRVRAVAGAHPRLADLADAFPGLLAALALPHPRVDARALIARVIAGAPLAAIAQAAGVAHWLRRFPAEVFAAAPPVLPDTVAFRRQIRNFIPKHWADAPRWLEIVAEAAALTDDDTALWFAREAPVKIRRATYGRRMPIPEPLKLVALLAWFSARPHTLAHQLLETPWNPAMQWNTALSEAYAWREAVRTHLYVNADDFGDPWLEPGRVDGFDFTPILTRAELAVEADAMRNCVRTYAADLADKRFVLWSIRKDGERVATLALAAPCNARFPAISQLAGPGNTPAPLEIWRAALRWLRQVEDVDFGDRLQVKEGASINVATWRALWKPYWLSKRRVPTWLPLQAEENVLWAL